MRENTDSYNRARLDFETYEKDLTKLKMDVEEVTGSCGQARKEMMTKEVGNKRFNDIELGYRNLEIYQKLAMKDFTKS